MKELDQKVINHFIKNLDQEPLNDELKEKIAYLLKQFLLFRETYIN